MSEGELAIVDGPERPLVLWDGECGFCRKWVDHWRDLVGSAVDFVPFQEVPEEALERWDLDPIELGQAMHFVEDDGRIFRGAAAALQILRRADGARFLLAADTYRAIPAAALVAEGIYRKVANNRELAARFTRFLWGEPHRQTFRMGQILFIRLLAVASFLAFWSMYRQVDGLLGANGILPIVEYLEQVTRYAESQGWSETMRTLRVPTLFWYDSGDAALRALCGGGMALSAALFLGLAPRLVIPAIWLGYLSIVTTGQVFLGYQWDALLLETLFVGWFVAPWQLWPGRARRVPAGGRWLVWLLTFKLMFLSGYVKWRGDEAWRSLEALDYHFWTQPIPNVVAWWADKLPDVVKALGVVFTLGAELGAPLLIFLPRRLRHLGAVTMIALQLMIMLTGTYGFFNVLALALSVLLLDDRWYEWLTRGRWTHTPSQVSRWALATSVAILVVVGTMVVRPLARTTVGDPLESLAQPVDERVRPFRTFNSYGVFARMTKTRPEIIVQGSHDGEEWFTYDFRWKPTAVDEPLRMTTLHMPRLDWQMWFAALGTCQNNRWFHSFQAELLRGNDDVERLLEDYDVEREPPRYVRSRLYQYTFGTDVVWTRRRTGNYCPVFELDRDGELRVHPDRSLY